jgi:hypothetical protein
MAMYRGMSVEYGFTVKHYTLAFVIALTATPSLAEWYDGGTLHQANAGQWQSASSTNKLATAADWASHILGKTTVREIGLSGLKKRAKQLSSCVTSASNGTAPNTAASRLAASCAVLMW